MVNQQIVVVIFIDSNDGSSTINNQQPSTNLLTINGFCWAGNMTLALSNLAIATVNGTNLVMGSFLVWEREKMMLTVGKRFG